MRRRFTGISLLAAVLVMLGLLLAPWAQAADGPAITGTLRDTDGKPVAAVAITVGSDGFSESAQTGADGTFLIAVPKDGSYTVAIDEATLPAGVTLANSAEASRSVLVLAGKPKRVLFNLGAGGQTDESSGSGGEAAGSRVPQLIVDGLLFGLMIALGAVGLNLIFGTTGLTNFSHGELLTLGAFTAVVINDLGVNIVVATPIAVVLSAVLWGWGQNRILWRPLRRRRTGLIAAMVVSIGLAITLRYSLLLVFKGSPRSYKEFAGQPGLEIGPVSITPKALILAGVAIVLLGVTVLWLQRSRIGKATRAVADNPALASATGIDVERVISVVWTLGAGLAAFAGIYLGITQNVQWNMGQRLLLVMFAAITLGGLGTVYGALAGSLIVGLFIQLSTLVIPTEMKTVGALFLMIVILLVRPQGLLGRRERVG